MGQTVVHSDCWILTAWQTKILELTTVYATLTAHWCLTHCAVTATSMGNWWSRCVHHGHIPYYKRNIRVTPPPPPVCRMLPATVMSILSGLALFQLERVCNVGIVTVVHQIHVCICTRPLCLLELALKYITWLYKLQCHSYLSTKYLTPRT